MNRKSGLVSYPIGVMPLLSKGPVMRTQGIVEYVDNMPNGGIKIKVNGTNFSAFDPSKVKVSVGDYVDFEYTEKSSVNPRTGAPVTYRNIKGAVNGTPQGGPVATASTKGSYVTQEANPGAPILDTQRLILRQNALTAAVNHLTGASPVTADDVIELAKKFEAYTSGDMDLAEVEESLSESED